LQHSRARRAAYLARSATRCDLLGIEGEYSHVAVSSSRDASPVPRVARATEETFGHIALTGGLDGRYIPGMDHHDGGCHRHLGVRCVRDCAWAPRVGAPGE